MSGRSDQGADRLGHCPYCGDLLTGRQRLKCGKEECRRAFNAERGRRWNADHPGYRGRYARPNHDSYRHLCALCGHPFTSHHKDGKYCSRRCRDLSRRKSWPSSPLPRRHPARQKPSRSRIFVGCSCAICGEQFLAIGVRHATCGSPSCVAEKRRAERRSRRAYERSLARGGRPGVFSGAQWGMRLREFSGCCAYCGGADDIEIEHVIPISRGGSNTIANVVPACRACNQDKGAMTPQEWTAANTQRSAEMDASGWPAGAMTAC